MQIEGVESFYPLTPLQQGLLFETLKQPSSGSYFNQFIARLDGSSGMEDLRSAWEKATARHAVLRTGFVWEGLREPVQVVELSAQIRWEVLDWTHLSEAEQQERLEEFLHLERERGFNLSKAPLSRQTVIRTTPDESIFVWSFHHLLLDGWSMYLVLKEVFKAYGDSEGVSSSVDRPVPFRDYVAWLRKGDTEAAKRYWRERLNGLSTAPLVLGRGEAPGKAGRVEDSRSVTRTLSRSATDSLVAMCRQKHITLNTAVMGTWALLLSRYTDRDDVVFGATVSGRTPDLLGSEEMVGPLINTLPVRVRVDEDLSAIDWLTSIQSEQVELRKYEYTPVFEIQGWCDLPREGALFDTVYMFENYRKDEALDESGRSLGLRGVEWYERTNYPLAIIAIPEERLFLKAVYHSHRFTRSRVDAMLGHWTNLIEAVATRPDALVGDLDVLTRDERIDQLVKWNQTSTAFPKEPLVPGLVSMNAERSPLGVAVTDVDGPLTFAELDSRAHRLAHYLSALGVNRGDLVSVCMERSAALIATVLAILKAGAAYVPLDPRSPAERLSLVLRDAGAKVLLTERSFRGRVPTEEVARGDCRVVFVDEEAATIQAKPTTDPGAGVRPSDPAYMVYTSGSTGVPKGTLINHASLLNLVHWHQKAFAVSSADRATQVAGPSFDAFGWEVWPYLASGASITVAPDEVVASPEEIIGWLERERITVSFLPTPLAERALALEWPDELPLRLLLTGGDRLRRNPRPGLPFTLVNNYGPTECTVVSTFCLVEPDEDREAVPTIGRPIANAQVYLLDRRLEPVPPGVPGELYIGGAGLAVGYHNRPELTAENFIANPFSADPDSRLYKSGDSGMYRSDGSIDFLGRIDSQVKIRGFRIELGEIETVLNRFPSVEAAVVTADPAADDPQLVAYVVPGSEPPTVGELKGWLRSKLPEYMVPAHFVWIDELPLTINGKVDYRALPPPELERARDYAAEAPDTDVERVIAAAWSDALGIAEVGRNDNFFDLGGHSLLITQVFGQLKDRFSQSLTLVDLFTYPTVASLAGFITGQGSTDRSDSRPHAQSARRVAVMRHRRLRIRAGESDVEGGPAP